MKAKRVLIVAHVVLVGILACNLPGSQNSQPDLAATITAQALTLQAAADTSGTPTETSISGVEVSITSVTNCRTGPSQAFDLVFEANPGQTFKVVGKNTPTNYLIINDPTGGTCWLWGQNAVVTGDLSILPEYPAPAAPTAKSTNTPKASKTPKPTSTRTSTPGPLPPAGPSGMSYDRSCEGYIDADGFTPKWSESITLTWQDNADNETGYRLYRNNSALPDLPPNSTTYHMTLRYTQGTGGPLFDNFQVEAFNGAGSSARAGVDVPKCP